MAFLKNKNFFLFVLAVFLLSGCYSTRFLGEDEFLVNRNKVIIDNKSVSASEVETYIQPKPNRKILWVIPFHLYVYNLSKIGKERQWKNKLGNVIGESPVIVNEFLVKRSKQQIEMYLRTKGYYYPTISDTIIKNKNKKAEVIYSIKTNKPFIIDSIYWIVQDQILKDFIKGSVQNSLLKPSIILDEEILQQERIRITEFLKNRGFYYFTKDFIQYEVDTSLGNFKVKLTANVLNQQIRTEDNIIIEQPHRVYRIDSVYVFYNYNPKLAIQNRQEYSALLDTFPYKNIYLVGNGKSFYNHKLLNRMNFIQPGAVYNHKDAQVTYDKYTSLNNFKLVNIQFINSTSPYKLNTLIQLSPLPRQTYQIEAEGTNSSGNLGIAGNILYTNRNLFGGAQNLNIGLHGSIERQTAVVQQNDQQIQEYLPFNAIESGANFRLRFPSFIFPFVSESFIKYKNPITQIQASYNFQQRPDYFRTITNLTFGYEWSGNKNLRHYINPVEINYVRIPFISWRFKKIIRGTFLENSFENHMEAISSYGFLFNDNKVGRQKLNSVYVRGKFEASGNMLYLIYNKWGTLSTDNNYQIFNVPFSQFIRIDLDYRYYKFITKGTKLVYRFYGGVGCPYGNSEVLPFNKRYFSGGASSIRAWAVRSLGPGSTSDTLYGNVFNQTGDIKLEGNLEYRFKLFWVVEPAFFVDVGNIWNIKKHSYNDKGAFLFNSFISDLALGYGLGLRFNFSFFIFRTDLAVKGRDPAEPMNNKWLFIQRRLQRDDFAFNIGIGYPF